MVHRIDDLVPLRTIDKVIPARYYNEIRLAILRRGAPLRLTTTTPKGVGYILDDATWLCVDIYHDDMPLLAWTEFRASDRGLHEPVRCRLRFYHQFAGLIMGTALDGLMAAIASDNPDHGTARI